MRLKASCPGCRKTFLLSDLHGGRRMRCLHCRDRFVVEKPTTAKRAPASDDDWFSGQSFHRSMLSDSDVLGVGGRPKGADASLRLDEARTVLVVGDDKAREWDTGDDHSSLTLAVLAVAAAALALMILSVAAILLFVQLARAVTDDSTNQSTPPRATSKGR